MRGVLGEGVQRRPLQPCGQLGIPVHVFLHRTTVTSGAHEGEAEAVPRGRDREGPDEGVCGDQAALARVMAAAPEVLNHNIETVPHLYRQVRPQGDYKRSLALLRQVHEGWPRAYVKSGLMVGLGERDEDVVAVMADLRRQGVDIVTIGQYLSPGPKHLPVQRFVTPEQFAAFQSHGEDSLGFLQVVSSCGRCTWSWWAWALQQRASLWAAAPGLWAWLCRCWRS